MSRFTSDAILRRRNRATAELNLLLDQHEAVVIFCGEPIQKPGGLDQTYPFLAHPDYYWLTGSRRAHGAVWYCKDEGWTDFVQPITPEEMLWEGGGSAPQGRPIQELSDWLKKKRIHVLGQPSASVLNQHPSNERTLQLQEKLNRARRIKDDEEIRLIRTLASFAHQGYQKLKSVVRPGVTERELQLVYESAVLSAGAEKFPYDSIIGSGVNSATLHAIPTQRILQNGELLLVDAGADIEDYCVDITRIFWADGSMSPRQKQIYDLVRLAQQAGIERCTPGTPWEQVHQASARVIAQGLKDLNILRGEVDHLLESGAIANFFPHGVGHLVGLRVRDVGGDVTRPAALTCGIRLRMNLNLEAGFIVTVEPGCYFVPAILQDESRRKKFASQVNWSEAEKWADFGGIRLEDDLLIREHDSAENLTAEVEK